MCNVSFILVVKIHTANTRTKSPSSVLLCGYQTAHWVKSERPPFLLLPWAISVMTTHSDKCVQLQRTLRPFSGPSRETLSQYESPKQHRSMSNDKAASWQSVHDKGTVVLSPSVEFPAYCQNTVCLTILWECYDLFIFKRGTSLFCLTVCTINYVWVKMFSLTQVLLWTTLTESH